MENIEVVNNDQIIPIEELKVIITQEVTETKTNFNGTLNDVIFDLSKAEQKSDAAIDEVNRLTTLRDQLQAELNKLPARVKLKKIIN